MTRAPNCLMLLRNLERYTRNGVWVRRSPTWRLLPDTPTPVLFGIWKTPKPSPRHYSPRRGTTPRGKSPSADRVSRVKRAAQELYLRLEKKGYISSEE